MSTSAPRGRGAHNKKSQQGSSRNQGTGGSSSGSGKSTGQRGKQGGQGSGRTGRNVQPSSRQLFTGGPSRSQVQQLRARGFSQANLDVHVPDGVRLQKVIADAGLGSRRQAEQLIEEGRVEVDGQIVMELGVRVDPARQAIHVDGLRVQLDTTKVTLALNKPYGVISAMQDPEGRPTIADFIKNRDERLFHVGRLDFDSEGLLLLTNDGELANRLSHPRYEVPKTYMVTVKGEVYPRIIKDLLAGVDIVDRDGYVDGPPARADKVKVVQMFDGVTLLELVLHEGRNRIVRRMFDAVDRPVIRLVRTRVGPIALGEQRPGTTRVLNSVEVSSLMDLVDL